MLREQATACAAEDITILPHSIPPAMVAGALIEVSRGLTTLTHSNLLDATAADPECTSMARLAG